MFKKLALVMACAISAAMFFTGCSEESSSGSSSSSSSGSSSSSSSSKIDQSSKKAVVRTFYKAIFADDYNTAWELFSPEFKQDAIKECGSKEKAFAEFKKSFEEENGSGSEFEEIKKVLKKDKEKFEVFIDEILKNTKEDEFVQIDGKWYINKLGD